MRYYAPALLFTLLVFYFYRLYVKKHRPQNAFPWSIWAAAACAGLLFFTHFVAALSLIIGLGICHLIFHTNLKKPEWNLWLAFGSVVAVCTWYLFSLGYITPDFEIRTNVFSIFYQEQNRFVRISSLLPLYLRFINIGGIAPWFVVVWVVWLAAKRLARKGAKNERVALFYGAAGLLITASCAVISPQQEYDQYAATRFFFIAFPFFAVTTAYFCLKIHSKSRIAGIALILLILNTTLLTWPFGIQNSPPLGKNYSFTDLPAPAWKSVNIFSFESTYAQFPLPAMAREFHSDHPTFIDGLTEFFEINGKQDETIAVYPTWAYYNMIWYLDEKFLFCCVHTRRHALSPEILNKYGVEIRADSTPDWLVLFGPARRQAPGRILAHPMKGGFAVGTVFNLSFGGGTKYVLVKKLDSLFFPVWRPELYWHSFSPVEISEDPRRGDVFILRRVVN